MTIDKCRVGELFTKIINHIQIHFIQAGRTYQVVTCWARSDTFDTSVCVCTVHTCTHNTYYIYISMDIALLRRAKQTHFDPQTHNIFFRMIALIVYWAWSSTEFDTQWHPFAIPFLNPCRQTPAAKQLLASDVFGCVTTVKSADQCEAKMKKIHSRSITEDHPRSPARRCP